MPEATFENVEPLLKDSKLDGRTMHMLFVCPATGIEVRASAEVPNLVTKGGAFGRAAAAGGIGAAEGRAREGLFKGAVGAVVGRSAADDVFDFLPYRWRQGRNRVQTPLAMPEDFHAAVVSGFLSVADRFTWDQAASGWVCRG